MQNASTLVPRFTLFWSFYTEKDLLARILHSTTKVLGDIKSDKMLNLGVEPNTS